MSAAGDLIDYLQDKATVSFDRALTAAHNLPYSAHTGQGAIYERELVPARQVPAATVPGIIPLPLDIAQFNVDFAATQTTIEDYMAQLQTSWLHEYFPAALPDGLDPLLEQILGGEIITAAEQEILWERAKAQGVRDGMRFEDEVTNMWGARGFSMPGGVVTNQIYNKQQELFHANADFAAQQAIKAIDLRVDAVKFAAEIGTKLRLGLIDGLTRMLDVYMRVPATAASFAAEQARAKQAAYGAIAEYYRTLIAKAELEIKDDIVNAENDLKYIAIAAQFIGNTVSNQVQAQTAQADIFARSAAASLSGLNGVASEVNQTIV